MVEISRHYSPLWRPTSPQPSSTIRHAAASSPSTPSNRALVLLPTVRDHHQWRLTPLPLAILASDRHPLPYKIHQRSPVRRFSASSPFPRPYAARRETNRQPSPSSSISPRRAAPLLASRQCIVAPLPLVTHAPCWSLFCASTSLEFATATPTSCSAHTASSPSSPPKLSPSLSFNTHVPVIRTVVAFTSSL